MGAARRPTCPQSRPRGRRARRPARFGTPPRSPRATHPSPPGPRPLRCGGPEPSRSITSHPPPRPPARGPIRSLTAEVASLATTRECQAGWGHRRPDRTSTMRLVRFGREGRDSARSWTRRGPWPARRLRGPARKRREPRRGRGSRDGYGNFQRRRWDSNPRNRCRFTGFRDRPFRPLRHPSGGQSISRRPRKNLVRSSEQAPCKTPAVTRMRWLSRGSSVTR